MANRQVHNFFVFIIYAKIKPIDNNSQTDQFEYHMFFLLFFVYINFMLSVFMVVYLNY